MRESDLQSKLLSLREEEEEEEEEERLSEKLVAENKKLWIIAIPSIFARFSTFGLIVISQAYVGHIGPTELAAFSLVSHVLVRFCNGILLGMASALETLCGQSYGAKQYHMLGIYLQRSWIILFLTTLIILPVFFFATPILILLGQDEHVALMAGKIAMWYIPIMFSYMWSFTFQIYLQSQSKNIIITYLAVIALVSHTILSWIFSIKLRLGLVGVLTSMIVSMWIPVIGQLGFVVFGGCPETWKGFSFSAFKDLWAIIKLSLSSGVMLCLELWYNSILLLLTGNMPNAEISLAALTICLNIVGWEMMVSFGLMGAAGVRVANELGAGSAKRTKFSIINVVAVSFLIGTVLFVPFLLFREKVAYVFTESLEVVRAVVDLSPLLAFSLLLNSIQPVLSGVAVGSGWQASVAYVNIACYYVVGVPLGIVLGNVLGLQGIWIGILLGTSVQTLVLAYFTMKTDWNKQVAISKQSINKWYMEQPPSSDNSQSPS